MRTSTATDHAARGRFCRARGGVAVLVVLIFALGGCATKRDRYDVPEVPMSGTYRASVLETHPIPPAGAATPGQSSEVPPGGVSLQGIESRRMGRSGAAQPYRIPFGLVLTEWWRLLDSAELDDLVNRVLANNPDIRIATLRVMQAKARAEQADADRYPVVTLPVRVGVEAPEGGIGTVRRREDIRPKHTYQASIRGDWRADLWGERHSLYESADMAVRQAIFQADEARRTAVATTVTTYIDYLSLNDRLRVARETEATLTEMMRSVEARAAIGDATAIELEQQRSAISAVRATIPVLEQQRDEDVGVLALLAGGLPGSLKLAGNGLSSLAYPGVSPGVPASLLLRRPDVRLVEARLLAADANIDVARARLLPPLDLTAQIGYGALHSSEWFAPHTLMWSAAASLMATIFDKGKLDNEVAYTHAVHQEMVESYVRVVYNAVREVEDALAAIRLAGRRAKEQQAAVEAARRAYEFSVESYKAGAIDYVWLLDTERTYYQSLDTLDKVYADRYKFLANLFAALGGGVRGRDPLPGDGLRPGAPEPETGYVLSLRPPSELGTVMAKGANVYQGIEVAVESRKQEYWLIELAGTYERAHIAPAWQDLRARFPALMTDRTLLPRSLAAYGAPGATAVSWYQLFVAGFRERREADKMCAALRQASMRCRTVSANEVPAAYAIGAVAEPVEISSSDRERRESAVDLPTPAKIEPAAGNFFTPQDHSRSGAGAYS